MVAARICFFEPWDPYGWITALSAHPVEIDGEVWTTAEHYYQAQKFVGQEEAMAAVKTAPDGKGALAASRVYKAKMRADWTDARKVEVMRRAFEAKFLQHADLAKDLLETGDALLVERTDHDDFWGDGPQGTGENWIGRLAMEMRERLRAGTL